MENTNTTNNTPTPEEIEQKSIAFKEKQEETNKKRYAWIATLPKEIQDRFTKIEEFVAWMDKENLPLLLIVNAFGYEFDRLNNKGFIHYQKFHGENDLYSEEGMKNTSKCYGNIIDMNLALLSSMAPVKISLEEPGAVYNYIAGEIRVFKQVGPVKSDKKEELNF